MQHVSEKLSRQIEDRPVIIFDGDDTLWRTQHLYDRSRHLFLIRIASLGFKRRIAQRTFDEIDFMNVSKFGFASTRFPTSMIDSYRMLCAMKERRPMRSIEKGLFRIGQLPFDVMPKLSRETRAILKRLAVHYRLVLLTAGDKEIQKAKINHLRLTAIFDRIEVVSMKTPKELKRVLRAERVRPENTILVGNSMRSDIAPALAVGVIPVLYASKSWRFDRSVNVYKTVRSITSLSSLPDLAARLLRSAGSRTK